ncbi:hypothetical protein [Engelhardtia mirabilis]|uniref:Uncharacterized protein n=1 Tax=Engelhardtia mirabilis TaxID=2528011 RepID=A0A518BT52_9BACT|nr:hypothetical protein Pla133_52760 [Planctomycetes bacterium Pla133]QDV04480.1 hypothetical protein Pla86_52760 [Planctomycetes bacterium Pla86]
MNYLRLWLITAAALVGLAEQSLSAPSHGLILRTAYVLEQAALDVINTDHPIELASDANS